MAKTPKKKLLVNAEYLANTGFSCVSENIVKNLIQHFDITVIDYSRCYDFFVRNDGAQVIGTMGSDVYGADRIIDLMEEVDCLLIINDVWNIDNILEKLKLSDKKIPPIVVYFPVDSEEHSAIWYKHFDIVTAPVTYTLFAKEVIKKMSSQFANEDNANELINKLSIVPHGVNIEKYYPIQDKNAVREELFGSDKFNNAYIVLNANRNQPRKRLDITMKAFAEFSKVYNGDAYLYMHSAINDNSIDLLLLAKRYGIIDKLIISTSILKPRQKPEFSEEMMNLMYNACDVGINTSVGEGWGLISCEHASTGAPQIIPRHSACKEVFNEIGFFIDADTPIMLDGIMTMAYIPSIESAADTLLYLSDRANREKYSTLCKERFYNEHYSWEFICKAWEQIINHSILAGQNAWNSNIQLPIEK